MKMDNQSAVNYTGNSICTAFPHMSSAVQPSQSKYALLIQDFQINSSRSQFKRINMLTRQDDDLIISY